MVPVSPAGTRGNFPRMCEAGGMKVHRLWSAAYYTAVALHHDETSCVQPTASGGDTENGHFRYLIPSYFHIHSYTCIYVHIRAYTCFSHLVVFCPLHLHILAYTCIYLHIRAYTGIYGQAGGDSEVGMHWHPLPVAFESESVTVLSWVCQTLRVRLPVAACGCGLADSESADLKRHGRFKFDSGAVRPGSDSGLQ